MAESAAPKLAEDELLRMTAEVVGEAPVGDVDERLTSQRGADGGDAPRGREQDLAPP